MINNPILTIGVPCYNEEIFLSKTLDSILMQSFKNFVVYICDDCSTDNSLKIAYEYSNLDSRIIVLSAKQKTNFVKNWNRSLEASSTKYFAWIGAHDILHADYFKDAIELLEANPKTVLLYPTSVSINVDGEIGAPTDSDIVTAGLGEQSALLKIASNLAYCTAIHGVFKADVLKQIPIKRIGGFDYLILFISTFYGEIERTKDVRFYRRTIREETFAEAQQRWKDSGMFQDSKYSYFEVLIRECLGSFISKTSLPRISRVITILRLINIFNNRFGVKKARIYRILFQSLTTPILD